MLGSSRLRVTIFAGLVFVAAGLAVLHLRYPLPYVFAVVTDQDPDPDDIHHAPANAISAAAQGRTLTAQLDPRISGLLERHSSVDRLDTLLDETQTTALVILHEGKIVEERYLLGHEERTVQNTFSVSKSFMSALIGLAVSDGVLELQAPITRYLPELAERDARFAEITVEHLLDMRSGIRYSREISFPFINQDDPLIYYFPDLESLVLERTEIEKPPGEFKYTNYNPPLLGLILRRTTGLSPSEYLEKRLWHAMGATQPAGWSTDARGIERMESGFHGTARDLALYGQLYLDGGSADERSVVPRQWVEMTTDFPKIQPLETYNGRAWGYRFGWWVVPRPEGPSDFCAIGHFGQYIYVSPQYDAVFVRNGLDWGEWSDRDWTELFYYAAERL